MTARRRLVDTAAAALALGVGPAAVRMLASRGRLTRHGTPGRALYDLDELEAYDALGSGHADRAVDHAVTLSAGRSLPVQGVSMPERITLLEVEGQRLTLDPRYIDGFNIAHGYTSRPDDVTRTLRHLPTGRATLTLRLSWGDALRWEPAG